MKILAIVCNIVLFLFTCFVLVTDGPPEKASYVVFAIWSLLTMIFSAIVIYGIGAGKGWLGLSRERKAQEEKGKIDNLSSKGTIMKIVAIICNVVFFGFVCWALVDQYPHPKEDGFIAFAVLMVLTPIINVLTLFRSGSGDGRLGLHLKSKT